LSASETHHPCDQQNRWVSLSAQPTLRFRIASRSLSSGAHSRDPLARNDGGTRLRVPAARSRPSLASIVSLERERAQGKPGVLCTRSLACNKRKHTSKSTTGTPKQSDLPCAMVYDFLRALPGVHDLLVTVARETHPANLTPAQGCQDHTPSPSAGHITRRSMWPASIASRLTFVTTRTPLSSRRDNLTIIITFRKTEAKYLFRRGWTGLCKIHLSGKSLRSSL